MSKTAAEMLEEGQAEVADVISTFEALIDDLRSAGSCETASDFCANVAEARQRYRMAKQDLEELFKLSAFAKAQALREGSQ